MEFRLRACLGRQAISSSGDSFCSCERCLRVVGLSVLRSCVLCGGLRAASFAAASVLRCVFSPDVFLGECVSSFSKYTGPVTAVVFYDEIG